MVTTSLQSRIAVALTSSKTTTQLLEDPPKPSKQAESDGLSPPNLPTLQKLDGLATEKLGEITRRFTAGERGWQGFDEAEIVAARELLEKSSSTTVR